MVLRKYLQFVVMIILIIINSIDCGDYNQSEINGKSDQILSRKERFIAFPVGSTFTVSTCMTVGVIGNPNVNYLSLGLNWGVAYELPNITWVLDRTHGVSKVKTPMTEPVVKRRYRRDLYQKLEIIMNGMGYNGRDCVLRALCESRKFFHSEKLGMIPELIRTIFSLPKARLLTREIEEYSDIKDYNGAYFSDGNEDCALTYPCEFSLLELAMGRYSEPPPEDFYG
ncbi:uncharacterized protein LOC129950723 [Eupeodes corollae]|uniref:uncharacterized protein LOC129950723 n=1 Tax=Eupeodes corollae TaxID=290404 RepID=UPI00248F5958|nr:uncharacterized protein LOC129950723 [Eupeodes corollae]